MTWQTADTAPRDGRIILLRREAMVFPAYFGLADSSFGAGATKRHPWTVLDPTNGVNHVNDKWASHWCELPAFNL